MHVGHMRAQNVNLAIAKYVVRHINLQKSAKRSDQVSPNVAIIQGFRMAIACVSTAMRAACCIDRLATAAWRVSIATGSHLFGERSKKVHHWQCVEFVVC